ncbi:MAG TPA: hypothetical protein VMN81_03895 [Vicinamibacterales bacterium]|nr:hypothetical protein [Vicinamibacterales bacterium]
MCDGLGLMAVGPGDASFCVRSYDPLINIRPVGVHRLRRRQPLHGGNDRVVVGTQPAGWPRGSRKTLERVGKAGVFADLLIC